MELKVCGKLFLLVCIAGSVYQMYDATLEYMQYATRTRVTREQVVRQQMPAIAICSTTVSQKFAHQTILHRLLLSPSIQQILNHCKVLNSSSLTMRDCMDVTRVTEYIDSMSICHSFFEERLLVQAARLPDYDVVSREFRIMDMNFSVPPAAGFSVGFVVYPPDQRFTIKRGFHNRLWLPPENIAEFCASISVETNIVLPPPFSTNCVDFRGTRFTTRAVALDHCLIQNFVHKGKHFMPFLSFESRDDSVDALSVRSLDTETERSLIAKAMAVCNAKLGDTDCHSTDYRIVQTSSRSGPEEQSTMRIVLTGLPSHQLRTELEPALPLLDFLNWIGSILNLWFGTHAFGCSCSTATFLLGKFIRKEKTKKKKKKGAKGSPTAGMSTWNQKLSRGICTLVWLSFALLAVFHVTDILGIYFDDPFKWNYFTKLPTDVRFPAVVFCVQRVIDPDKVRIRLPHVYANSDGKDWDRRLSLSQQLRVTVDADELFMMNNSFFTWRETMTWDRLGKHFKFKKYLSYRNVCFKTFSPTTRLDKRLPVRSYQRSLMEMMQYFMVTLRMDPKFGFVQVSLQFDDHFTVFGRDRLDPGNLQNVMIATPRDKRFQVNRVMINHREMEEFRKDDHSISNCIPYARTYGKMRSIMLENCVKEQIHLAMSNKSANAWPRQLFYSDHMSGIGREQELFFADADDYLGDKMDVCQEKYPMPDCSTSTVETAIEDAIPKPKGRNTLKIVLYPPGKGYIELRQDLRFTVFGILGLVGGTIGFWVGFAVTDVATIIHRVLSCVREIISSVKRTSHGKSLNE